MFGFWVVGYGKYFLTFPLPLGQKVPKSQLYHKKSMAKCNLFLDPGNKVNNSRVVFSLECLK